MADLKVTTSISMSTQGLTIDGKQGTASNPAATALTVSVTGTVHKRIGTITSGATNEVLAYDGTVDNPSTWDYLFYWADQDTQIQLLTAGTSVTLGVLQYVPFVLSNDAFLCDDDAATNNVAEATLVQIDEITVGNYSGSTANYVIVIID